MVLVVLAVGCQLADEPDHFLIYQEIPVLKRIFRVDIACAELAPLFGNLCHIDRVLRIDLTRLQDNNSSGGLATCLDTNPGISISPRNVLNGR